MVNSEIILKIKCIPGAVMPEYQSHGASGADLFAFNHAPIVLEPGDTQLIPTGIFMEIPEGYEVQIRPRSGLAIKHGLTLLNSPGTIDSDYRGEIKIILTNLGKVPFTVTKGMRIAQMVVNRYYRAEFHAVSELLETKRNDGGFGHTGV